MPSRSFTRTTVAAVLALSIEVPSVDSQTLARWDTHDELQQWIVTMDASKAWEDRTEGETTFVRFRRDSFERYESFPVFTRGRRVEEVETPQGWPTLLDPKKYNAVRIRLRQTIGFKFMRGFWFHRFHTEWEATENFSRFPWFNPRALHDRNEWQEVTFMLSDAQAFDPNDDIVQIMMGFFGGDFWSPDPDNRAAFHAAPPDTYLDIDRIEFVLVPKPEAAVPESSGRTRSRVDESARGSTDELAGVRVFP